MRRLTERHADDRQDYRQAVVEHERITKHERTGGGASATKTAGSG